MTVKSGNIIVQSRAELRSILQRAGIARAAADRIAKGGWDSLSEAPDNPTVNIEEDLRMSINAIRERRGQVAAKLHALINKSDYNDARDRPAYNQMLSELDSIDDELKRYQAANERIAAQVRMAAPSGSDDEHIRAFENFLRAPKDVRAQQNLRDAQVLNVASGGVPASGGYLVPEVILGPLMQRAVSVNPFRNLVRVVQVGTRDVTFPLANSDMSSGWIGEAAPRDPTDNPTVTVAKPTFGTLYSYISATEELVMDSAFDIQNWFSVEAGLAMGVAEMNSIIFGNGTDKPTGLLNSAPTTGADGTRAGGVLKYLPTGHASTLGSAPADLLISMVYDLKAAYRANGTFLMNSAVAGEIRKLKDSQGRFLWADSLAPGEPATLLGFPVAIAESMSGVGSNDYPIMFGDFSRAYILCENGPLYVTVDENITQPGRVKWYIRRRLGGITYDNDAVRVIKVAAT